VAAAAAAPELVGDIGRGSDVTDRERLGEAVGGAEALASLDPLRLLGALADLADPWPVTTESVRAAVELARVAIGTSEVAIPPRDKRFADPAWRENPLYRRWAQGYLVWTDAIERLASTRRLREDWRRESRARFASALLTSALAPTNLIAGNPAAIKRAFDTGGLSLVRGLRNFLRDVRTNGGMPSQVDMRPFRVGENLAATPGAVIHREELFEVLQYRPTTRTVGERPLLMVPPQVNKHYFLDLAPGRSLVEYLVDHGVHFFTIVWRNPRSEHGRWGIEDYVAGQLRAIDVVRDVAASDDVNLLGACAGGLTSALMLGHLAATGSSAVNAAAFAITMIDSRYPNLLTMMATDRMLRSIAGDAVESKVYERSDVARTFAWMRPNDLVFNYAVNNWLMGEDPPAFDILAWNNDGTNLSACFDSEMLDIYAHNRAAQPGGVRLWDTPIDLGAVDCDNYVVAGLTDHITPWMPCYETSRLLAGRSEVVITSTGHIQTMVNPPGKPRAHYFAAAGNGAEPEDWIAGAEKHEGSWWPHFAEWLRARSGEQRAAPRRLGSSDHTAQEPAPGLYVLEQ
jgi:polyhydroxyalkanoate synthase